MNIPAVLKCKQESLDPLEADAMRYIVGYNGVFLERNTAIFRTSTRVDVGALQLETHTEMCHLKSGKLPRKLHQHMLTFFRAAAEMHGGEAALVLLYHPERRVYRWHCPRQYVQVRWSQGRWMADDTIEFDNPLQPPEGFLQLGDAHLHPGSSPLPSAMDIHDDQDGVHIIVCSIDSTPKYHVTFEVDGRRFRVEPEHFFADMACLPRKHPPSGWLQQIVIEHVSQSSQQATWQRRPSVNGKSGSNGTWYGSNSSDNRPGDQLFGDDDHGYRRP